MHQGDRRRRGQQWGDPELIRELGTRLPGDTTASVILRATKEERFELAAHRASRRAWKCWVKNSALFDRSTELQRKTASRELHMRESRPPKYKVLSRESR
jgi:hypothetical protein